jgi:hypothetical protein
LSSQSYESGVSSRQSYHSTSSSSVGSLDRLEESGQMSTINVAELFRAGMPVCIEIFILNIYVINIIMNSAVYIFYLNILMLQ